MDLWTPEMTQLVVSTAITILVPYLVFAADRYLKVRLDEAARSALDTAMRNGADWVIREGRLPTPKEVLEYVHRAAPDAVAVGARPSEPRHRRSPGAGGDRAGNAGSAPFQQPSRMRAPEGGEMASRG